MDPSAGSEAIVHWQMYNNASTGTTNLTIRVRQGSGITGTQLQSGTNVNHSVTAANNTVVSGIAFDSAPGTNLLYTLTVATTGTTVVSTSALNVIIAYQVAD